MGKKESSLFYRGAELWASAAQAEISCQSAEGARGS
jgi:hypothetical protein